MVTSLTVSSPYPTPFTVGWHTAVTPAGDDPETTYTPALVDGSNEPVDGTAVKVMGWAPATSTEPQVGRVEHDIDLFCTPGTACRPNDVVDLPLDRSLGRFEVVGYPLDWTKGPFGFTPGMVVQLRRVEG